MNIHKEILSVIFILLFPIQILSAYQISGQIYRMDTKGAVESAYILLKSTGDVVDYVQTREDGSFLIEDVDEGGYILQVKAVGYYTESMGKHIQKDEHYRIYLTPKSTMSLGEVEVVGDKDRAVSSKTTIPEEIQEKATASVTGDPVEVLRKMPGVEPVFSGISIFGDPKNSTGLSVRGGNGFETIAFLDQALITYPYHRVFPDSVFIADVVGDIVLYKGVLPAQYGQAMSGLLNVDLKEGATGFHGKISLGILNTFGTLKGGTPDGKWDWIAGARRMHYDLILSQFIQIPEDQNLEIQLPYYLDTQGRIRYRNSGEELSFIWHYSDEPTKLLYLSSNETSGMDESNETVTINDFALNARLFYPNMTFNLNWKHPFNDNLVLNQTVRAMFAQQVFLFYVGETNALSGSDQKDRGMERSFKATENNVLYRGSFDITLNENHTIRPGLEALFYPNLSFSNIMYLSYSNTNTQAIEQTNFLSGTFASNFGIYTLFIEDESSLMNDKLIIRPGVRAGYTDFINEWFFDPRFSLEWRNLTNNKSYLSVGRLSQFPTDPTILTYFNTNQDQLKISSAVHYVIGNEWEINPAYTLSSEAYFKDYDHEINQVPNEPNAYRTEGTDKHIYGFEGLLMKKEDQIPVYGWLGASSFVTWRLRDERQNTNSLTDERIPVEQWYKGDSVDYKFNLMTVWDINRYFSLTFEAFWKSGGDYTPIIGSDETVYTYSYGTNSYTNTYYDPVYGDYHSAKYEDEHYINLKLQHTGMVFNIPYGIYLQVNNVYNHLPLLGYEYSYDYSEKYETRLPLGIYPLIGFWAEW